MSSKDGKYWYCYKKNNQKSVLIKKENYKSLILKKLYQKYLSFSSKFSTPLCPPDYDSLDFAIQKLQ